jgi:DNA invertase Pin-like site-specific DNA recombinase
MSTAIGYAGRSKESDRSIAQQRQRITAYCDEHEYQLQTVFEDESLGPVRKRPAFERFSEFIHDEEINSIVISGMHQFGRDVDAVLRVVTACRRANVEFHTVDTGRVDISAPVRAVLNILGEAPSQTDRLRRLEETLLEIRERHEQPSGLGQPRFGMEYDESTSSKQVPGDRFEDVLTILEMPGRGESYPAIADAVDITKSQAYRVVQRRECYYDRADTADIFESE